MRTRGRADTRTHKPGYTGATVRVRPRIRTAAHPYPSSYIFVSGQLHLCSRTDTDGQPGSYKRTAVRIPAIGRTNVFPATVG
ncbi:hypothetical protein NXX40_15400 [Parabacteroides distasonis]|nr:hypothetical protein [Parabacteroides distasonis]